MFDHFTDERLMILLRKENDHRDEVRKAYYTWQKGIVEDAVEQILDAVEKRDGSTRRFAVKRIAEGLVQAIEYATERVPYKPR